jgi:hypothetical protein
MPRKYLYGIPFLILAFVILSVSVMDSIAVNYVFAAATPVNTPVTTRPEVEYEIPYPGRVRQDSFLWVFKAIRDRIEFISNTNNLKKAELALLYSDKRLLLSRALLEEGKPDMAISALGKGEKYLEIAVKQEELAREKGVDTGKFLSNLATASLKHRQIVEEMVPKVPEDAKPEVIRIADYSKNTYKYSYYLLNSKGLPAPINPFEGEK